MAFQLERAFSEKKTIFAEAGVGTGKTLVYLLYAINYAYYTKKPAVISCADESLIEQLVKQDGDIAKLSSHLGLSIDARLAKSPEQYLCLNKLHDARYSDAEADVFESIYRGLPPFVRTRDSLQHFHAYGDRKDYSELNDAQWKKINWDIFQDCTICDKRHRCGLTLSRMNYRHASDLIVCSHDYYTEHLWTADSRKRAGQLPYLPDHSAIVFDEGHLLEFAAQKALTYQLKISLFEEIITRVLQSGVREALARKVEQTLEQCQAMFGALQCHVQPVPGSDRMTVMLSEPLLGEVHKFRYELSQLEEQLAVEAGLYSLSEYHLRLVDEHLEMLQSAMRHFQHTPSLITWATVSGGELILWIMPREVKDVLQETVFGRHLPIVFSSATLSVDGSFRYMTESLGIVKPLSFSVPSPYDYEQQMMVFAPKLPLHSLEGREKDKMDAAFTFLKRTQGRAMLLFPSREELQQFKQHALCYPDYGLYAFLFEGDKEISHLIASFQREQAGVLCAVSLWEGLDIPGPALSNVTIWSLPFPPHDPVFNAKRKDAVQPYEEVDLPYMLLRLRQGMGRLIRTSSDKGIVVLLDERVHEDPLLREQIQKVLPDHVSLHLNGPC
ncbi:putative ATP-dependent DNA helicase YoaA [Paenibacillus solanacearum]|uniref:ATP-dependent DNA helicase YoaA n=2 Tax=Paenibacillus solanacearum TaxID=2048548 RepID=A0A916NHF1_9BACL|nr:putative ATP-dependent DNA helicase YoaA [Paenibacillus solanacearum]